MLRTNSIRIVLVLCAGLVLCGCQQTSSGLADEEKEPQFLIGRNQVNAMNFSGAIEAFQRALEMNPHSSAAHFELGWLYAEKQTDEAAAIYHYQQYLKLRPGANNAEMIQQIILRLKQELARAALPIPPSSDIQRQMENLAAENRRLQGEVDQLRRTLAQNEVSRATLSSPTVARVSSPVPAPVTQPTTVRSVSSSQVGAAPPRLAANATSAQSHRVKPGETPASIARQYRVSLDALLDVNPGLNARRIQIGQNIMLPRH